MTAESRQFHFPAAEAAASAARASTRDTLTSWQVGTDTTSDAVLLVSELITNAIRASAGRQHHLDPSAVPARDRPIVTVCLCITRTGPRILLEVWDPDDNPPVLQEQSDAAEDGRGLFLVDTVSTRWSWRRSPAGGKTVWAELRIGPDAPEAEIDAHSNGA
ncbi:ATP-binding protein [Parafrankia elaeagni]|uniref:ATP-binding protein n=1 Tax=Parafrankia elaeagni TaxID=222534 RepID=UPI00036BE8BD|nr:ATP-binding protein [Parafrankia elaeagni]